VIYGKKSEMLGGALAAIKNTVICNPEK